MYPTEFDLPLSGLDWLEYYPDHRVYHPGVDFNKGYGDQDLGQDIFAPRDGFVDIVYTGWNHRGFGKFIIIKHADGNYTRYAHLGEVLVTEKTNVKEGDLIAKMGKTGTKYAHLHFEVFNEKMAEIQRKNWYTWRYYPVNKYKQWVIEHYLNPWEWLKPKDVEMEEALMMNAEWKPKPLIAKPDGSYKTDKEILLILKRFKDGL